MGNDIYITSILPAIIAAKNAMIIAIITAVVSLLGAILSFISTRKASKISKEIGEKNIEALDKQRFIATISLQRVEWINKLRDEFVEFNKKTHTVCMVIFSEEKGINNNYNYGIDYQDIIGVRNHIELLLNPKEFFSEKLILFLNKIVDILFSGNLEPEEYNQYRELLTFTQQVILKSEWKRIKIETKNGDQINDNDMNKIFEEVAKEIDENKYNKMFLFS